MVDSTRIGNNCTAQAFNSGWRESGQASGWVSVLASASSAHSLPQWIGTKTVPGEIAFVTLAGNLVVP